MRKKNKIVQQNKTKIEENAQGHVNLKHISCLIISNLPKEGVRSIAGA